MKPRAHHVCASSSSARKAVNGPSNTPVGVNKTSVSASRFSSQRLHLWEAVHKATQMVRVKWMMTKVCNVVMFLK